MVVPWGLMGRLLSMREWQGVCVRVTVCVRLPVYMLVCVKLSDLNSMAQHVKCVRILSKPCFVNQQD